MPPGKEELLQQSPKMYGTGKRRTGLRVLCSRNDRWRLFNARWLEWDLYELRCHRRGENMITYEEIGRTIGALVDEKA